MYPDGRAIYITDGVIRARFNNDFENPKPIEKGSINCYTIDLWHIGHEFKKGHKIRLEISSGAFLRFDVNACTGGDLAHETEYLIANIEILHDQKHKSRLVFPVIKSDNG